MTWRFSAWCPLKSHRYLNLQLKAAVLVGYVLPFNEHQTLKFKIKIHKNTAIRRQPPEVFNKKGFLKISQNSLENACARASFLKKRRLWHKCFPVNFAKFLRIPFLQNTSGGCFCFRVLSRSVFILNRKPFYLAKFLLIFLFFYLMVGINFPKIDFWCRIPRMIIWLLLSGSLDCCKQDLN